MFVCACVCAFMSIQIKSRERAKFFLELREVDLKSKATEKQNKTWVALSDCPTPTCFRKYINVEKGFGPWRNMDLVVWRW